MFNEHYAYRASGSVTMQTHFRDLSRIIKTKFSPGKILEIGPTDGPFIRNFDKNQAICVEPCRNFAKELSDDGYNCYNTFWDLLSADAIDKDCGKIDVIYSANCMCHIPQIEEAFRAVKFLLDNDGVFIFEDPSLLEVIKMNTYDQFYDEHAHVFSVTALNKLLEANDLMIVDIETMPTHGGSNRIYARHQSKRNVVSEAVRRKLSEEEAFGLDDLQTYLDFARRVKASRDKLIELFNMIAKEGIKIIGYGATSKSTVVLNYCQIDSDYIQYFTDTTPEKQCKLMPGQHIPIVAPVDLIEENVDYAFLGAWNFRDEIMRKEKRYIRNGGAFITHVPDVMVI
jgi:methylation protein EvaC